MILFKTNKLNFCLRKTKMLGVVKIKQYRMAKRYDFFPIPNNNIFLKNPQ